MAEELRRHGQKHISTKSVRYHFDIAVAKLRSVESTISPKFSRGNSSRFYALRNRDVAGIDRDPTLPASRNNRLANRAISRDGTEGYAPDWTVRQLLGAPPTEPTS